MGNIKTISLDLETYSDVDLAKSGVYKYCESPAFEILLLGVSVDRAPVVVYDLASGDTVPEELLRAIARDTIVKTAFNASFERVCLSAWLRRYRPDLFHSYGAEGDTNGAYLNPVSWRCSMVLSAYNGLPQSLEKVGAVLGFEEQKLKAGKDLIRYFCVPCSPTKANGGRTRNRPQDAAEKWELFKKYNKRDVEVELAIQERLAGYPVPETVWEEYHISEEINDRGILIDLALAENAVRTDDRVKEELLERMRGLTGLENPGSVVQLKDWLQGEGVEADSLGKKDVARMIPDAPDTAAEVLRLRLMAAKSSVKKYTAMQLMACEDNRCRGAFRFYGANRTGRFSGRNIQLQNLPQNHMSDLAQARELVRRGDYETLQLLYDNIPDVLSQLIRTTFVPRPGYKFIVSDYSSIEARVLAWLANEKWKMQAFAEGQDVYCATASRMFGVHVVKHGINGELRQKGKICELANGYGGSVGAMKAMGAIDLGLKEDELQPLVTSWRDANPNIVAYWWKVDKAVKQTIKQRIPTAVGSVRFECRSGMLFIWLPSGRRLSYVKPRIGVNRFGGESVTYMGNDSQKRWGRVESYGPKFTENIVQAISRDILCCAMKALRGYYIVGHVHDELIIECPQDTDLKNICATMGQTPEWAPGLLLRADGYECEFYRKD